MILTFQFEYVTSAMSCKLQFIIKWDFKIPALVVFLYFSHYHSPLHFCLYSFGDPLGRPTIGISIFTRVVRTYVNLANQTGFQNLD